jgi:L-alanine-DL-glutamate epimerase-like enolase superfamily enzyme
MKITGLEAILVALPIDEGNLPHMPGRPRWNQFPVLLVRVDTDEGLTGWGEAFGFNVATATKEAIDRIIAPMVVGEDAADIAGISARINRAAHMFGRNGPFSYGLGGVDIALWDLAGKAAGLPLHRLLGGAARTRVTAYASLLQYTDAKATAEAASEAVRLGYRHVKLHEVEAASITAGREAAGASVDVMVDVNCAWTIDEALALAPLLSELDLRWVEEPVWPPESYEALARLRRAGIRTSAGENIGTVFDFNHFFKADALDVAQPDVMKIGGVTEMLKVLTLAEVFGVRTVPHAAMFGPGFLATIQVIASRPTDALLERLFVDLNDTLYPGFTEATGGTVTVPQGPGLGAEPDPDVIERYRIPATSGTR